jgi:hypothetical protein
MIAFLKSTGLKPKRISVKAHSRMESRDAGSEVPAGSSSTMSSR